MDDFLHTMNYNFCTAVKSCVNGNGPVHGAAHGKTTLIQEKWSPPESSTSLFGVFFAVKDRINRRFQLRKTHGLN